MRWDFSPELELYQESVRDWLTAEADTDRVRAWLDTGSGHEFEIAFAEAGWAGVGFPEAVGGQGGGLLELAVTAEELGRRAAPSASWIATAVAGRLLDERLGAAALGAAEALVLAVDAHRPPDAPALASLGADGLVRGEIARVVGAGAAASLVVPASSTEGHVLVLVDAQAQGVTVSPADLLDRSRSAAVVVLDDVAGTVLPVDAAAELSEAAMRAAVLTAADALGTMEQMLEITVEYSKQREQFGRPIGSFQAVKHTAAEMLVAVEAARSIVMYAASSVDQGMDERAVHAAVAKAQTCAAAAKVADSALTLHGAIGYTWEHSLHLFYKRAKVDAVLWGSAATWNERVARSLPLLPT